MEQFIKISLIIHVIAGTAAIIFGGMAMIFKSKTAKHKPMGRYYFYSMTVIFVTGIYLSIYSQNLFLFFVSFFTYYSTLVGYRSIVLKNRPTETLDKVVDGIAGSANLSLVAFGIYMYLKNGHIDAAIPIVFGLLGLGFVYSNVKRHLSTFVSAGNQWLLRHISNMMGSYIGAITAFTVNQAWKIHVPNIISWLGPTALLVPIIVIELRKVRKRTQTKAMIK